MYKYERCNFQLSIGTGLAISVCSYFVALFWDQLPLWATHEALSFALRFFSISSPFRYSKLGTLPTVPSLVLHNDIRQIICLFCKISFRSSTTRFWINLGNENGLSKRTCSCQFRNCPSFTKKLCNFFRLGINLIYKGTKLSSHKAGRIIALKWSCIYFVWLQSSS